MFDMTMGYETTILEVFLENRVSMIFLMIFLFFFPIKNIIEAEQYSIWLGVF